MVVLVDTAIIVADNQFGFDRSLRSVDIKSK